MKNANTYNLSMPAEIKKMALAEAKQIVSPREASWSLRNMVKALGMLPFLNTEEDWKRKRAAELILASRRKRG